MKCKHDLVKRGLRKTKLRKKQVYKCRKCGKKVTTDWPRMRFERNDVMFAVELYSKGKSLSKVQSELKQRGVKVSRWTILKWHKKFG